MIVLVLFRLEGVKNPMVQNGKLSRPVCSVLVTAAISFVAVIELASQRQPVSLDGVVDLHVHAGPDSRPRSVSDTQAAKAAQAAGMRAILLKNHFTMTADRAVLAMEQVDGIEIFGGIVLNRAVGGINPEAVRQMVQFAGGRGRVVWLPTFDAEWYVTNAGGGEAFVSIMQNGRPAPAVLEVFSLIGEYDLLLAMGHSAPEEVLALIPEAIDRGVTRILVTHVFSQGASLEQMKEMASTGALMEIDWLAVHNGGRTITDYAEVIGEIGAEHFVMSSDLGQADTPLHHEGWELYIRAMQEAGLSAVEINRMARANPAFLLGLEP